MCGNEERIMQTRKTGSQMKEAIRSFWLSAKESPHRVLLDFLGRRKNFGSLIERNRRR